MDENNDQAFSPNKISILCCGNQIKDTKMKVMFTLHDLLIMHVNINHACKYYFQFGIFYLVATILKSCWERKPDLYSCPL